MGEERLFSVGKGRKKIFAERVGIVKCMCKFAENRV